MLRLALLIGWKDCQVRFRSRVVVMFVVVLPLAMTIVTGLAFRGFAPQRIHLRLGVIVDGDWPALEKVLNDDKDPGGNFKNLEVVRDFPLDPAVGPGLLEQRLPADAGPDELLNVAIERATAAVVAKRVHAALVLTKSSGMPWVRLLHHANPSPERTLAEAIYARVADVLRQDDRPATVIQDRFQNGRPDFVQGFNSFTQAVAGNGVMFVLLNCLTGAGIALVRERRQNTLARLLISPASRTTVLLGKLLGVFYVGLAQAVVVFGFGAVAFGIFPGGSAADVFGNVVGVSLVTLLLILVACAMGLMISALSRREETAESVGVPIAVVLTALGGGMFPLGDNSPAFLRTIALGLPSGWAMDGYHKLLWYGQGLSSIGPNLLVLAAFAAVFLWLGVRKLQWE